MNTIVDRIKFLMHENGLQQRDLAMRINCTQSAISQWLSGKRPVPSRMIKKIAKEFNVTAYWIEYEVNEKGEVSEHSMTPKSIALMYPSDFKSSAADILRSIDQLLTTRISTKEILDMYISDDELTGHRIAALKANRIDAMYPAYPDKDMIFEGEYLILDFDKKPSNGDVVVASHQESTIIRLYIEDGNKYFLKPLNPQYPIIETNSEDIIAVVIKRQR